MSTPIPTATCPYCGYVMDTAASPIDKTATPSPGDVSMCLSCTQVLIFDDQLRMVKPTDAQMAELREYKEGWELLKRMQRVAKMIDRSMLTRRQ